MKYYPLIALFLLFSGTNNLFAQSCFGSACLSAEVKNSCTENKSNGCIDWENGVIYATGMGVPNPSFPTAAQKRYSAYEAAKVVAMRNLLQMVEEINITSTRTVKMGMLESDDINTQINGKLRNVQESGQPKSMNDGSIFVTMKMFMRDIRSIILGNEHFNGGSQQRTNNQQSSEQSQGSAEKAPEKSSDSIYGGDVNTQYGGLIIDARDSGVSPAMSPKIYDKNGLEVYGSAAVERDFALRSGIVGYVKGLENAQKNDRIRGNALIIKAVRSSKKSSDLVISEKDAKLLRELEANQTFLREARVIIVIG
ncbi:MAG: hypothetical protein GY786_10085 [Proteobacteria bacterium]|nr:hypothetical protein [Pseudomonadota bacterium]